MARQSRSAKPSHNHKKQRYDWAAAATSLMEATSESLKDLAAAADLDPYSGDLRDIDLSGLDLRGQDMSGWDLLFANFRGAKIAGANLIGARLNPDELIQALGWSEAQLDESLRSDISDAPPLVQLDGSIAQLGDLPILVTRRLKLGGIHTISDLIESTAGDILRISGIGRMSLRRIKIELQKYSLKLDSSPLFDPGITLLTASNRPQAMDLPLSNLRKSYEHLSKNRRGLAIRTAFEEFEVTLNKYFQHIDTDYDSIFEHAYEYLLRHFPETGQTAGLVRIMTVYNAALENSEPDFTSHQAHNFLEDIEWLLESMRSSFRFR